MRSEASGQGTLGDRLDRFTKTSFDVPPGDQAYAYDIKPIYHVK